MAVLLQEDFSGGIVSDASNYASNECANISGLWHHRGDLEPMRGPSVILNGATAANDRDELTVYSHHPYTTEDGITYILARRGSSLWVGIPNIDYDRPQHASCVAFWDMKDLGDEVVSRRFPPTGNLINVKTIIRKLWSGAVRVFGIGSCLWKQHATIVEFGAGSRTISTWIRCTETAAVIETILAKMLTGATYAGYILQVNADGTIGFSVIEDGGVGGKRRGINGTTNVRTGGWFHVLVSYTAGSTPVLYVTPVDSVAVPTAEGAAIAGELGSPDTTNTEDFYVGKWSSVGNFFNGEMGTLSLYSTDLSAADTLAQFTAEKARYTDPGAVTYNWYPLHGGSYIVDGDGNPQSYLRERSEVCPETFQQIDQNVYCTTDEPNSTDYLLVWRGMVERRGRLKGTADPTGGYFELEDTEYAWPDKRILPGDTVYIFDHDEGEWLLHGHVIKYARGGKSTDGPLIYVHDAGIDTTGKGPAGSANYCDYCIVRVHRPGITSGTTCAAVDSGAGAGMAGPYNYAWRYRNSVTGYIGRFSDISAEITPPLNHHIDVSGWPTDPPDQDVDTFEIIRQDRTGNIDRPYYTVQTVDLLDYGVPPGLGDDYWHRHALAATYHDDGWTDGEQLTDTAFEYCDRAGAYGLVKQHDNRLYAADGNYDRVSALDDSSGLNPLLGYEYMPAYDPRLGDTGDANFTNIGGVIQVGASANEPITAMITETGSYELNGVVGGNLLIFTGQRAYRWFGWDITDFQGVTAFSVGCNNHKTLVKAEGNLIWSTGDRIVAMPLGGNTPVEISGKMWAYGFREKITAADKERCTKAWCAAYWQGWYILSFSLSAYEPDTTWCYHLASGTSTTYPFGYNDFAIWKRIGVTSEEIITGSVQTGAGATGNISGLWLNAASYAFSVTTGPLVPEGTKRDEVFNSRTVDRFSIQAKSPVTTDVTLTVTPYVNGDLTNAAAAANSAVLAHIDAATGKRAVGKTGQLACSGFIVQAKVSGTSTVPFRIEKILADEMTHGRV